MSSIKKFDGRPIIFPCIWVAFLLVVGAYLYEQQGIFGKWFQVFGAGLLILVGLYDLAPKEKWSERVKGISISLCSLILLVPALHAAIN